MSRSKTRDGEQELNFVHVERQDYALFLVIIIGLSTNCVYSDMF